MPNTCLLAMMTLAAATVFNSTSRAAACPIQTSSPCSNMGIEGAQWRTVASLPGSCVARDSNNCGVNCVLPVCGFLGVAN